MKEAVWCFPNEILLHFLFPLAHYKSRLSHPDLTTPTLGTDPNTMKYYGIVIHSSANYSNFTEQSPYREAASRLACHEIPPPFFGTISFISVFTKTNHRYLSQYLTNLMHKILFHNKFYSMLVHVSSTCAHHQEVTIALHIPWYHHTYRCNDTRGCVMQLWPPDDGHMCSKHVEAWNKTYCETKFCASSWLNTEINILRCMVSKTSTTDVLYPDQMNPVHTLPPHFRSSFILLSPPCLQLPSEMYPSSFLAQFHMHFLYLIFATCPTHPNLLELINPVYGTNNYFWEWSQ